MSIGRRKPAASARSACPRCASTPRGARWRGQEYLRCGGCETGWWDRVTLGRVATLASDSLDARVVSAEVDAAPARVAGGDCPACGVSQMETAVWNEIPIHRCAACGTTGLAQAALVGRLREQRRAAARQVARSSVRGMFLSVLGPLLDFVPLARDRYLFPAD